MKGICQELLLQMGFSAVKLSLAWTQKRTEWSKFRHFRYHLYKINNYSDRNSIAVIKQNIWRHNCLEYMVKVTVSSTYLQGAYWESAFPLCSIVEVFLYCYSDQNSLSLLVSTWYRSTVPKVILTKHRQYRML